MDTLRAERRRLFTKYRMQMRFLGQLSRQLQPMQLPGYDMQIMDVHIFPGNVDSSSNPHLHSFVEIHIPVRGAGEIILGNKKQSFSAGQFTVTSADRVHHWQATEAPILAHVWWVKLTPNQFPPDPDLRRLFDALSKCKRTVYQLPEDYFPTYDALMNELRKKSLGYQQTLPGLTLHMLISLARSTVGHRRRKTLEKPPEAQDQDRMVKLVEGFLEDNVASAIVLDDLARHARTSKRNLTRYYKAATGKTIGQRLNELRMYKAEELIRETDLQIKAIATRCGFRHIPHFAKQFKETFHHTPTDYRRKLLTESDGRTVNLALEP